MLESDDTPDWLKALPTPKKSSPLKGKDGDATPDVFDRTKHFNEPDAIPSAQTIAARSKSYSQMSYADIVDELKSHINVRHDFLMRHADPSMSDRERSAWVKSHLPKIKGKKPELITLLIILEELEECHG